ncbi:MAG: hypothetical protein IJJ74_01690 [Eubacterium sp.]|nr:hypothetical protein [Eubacterium sp.]
MYLYENGSADKAVPYLRECLKYYLKVEETLEDAENKKKYKNAISKAKSGSLDEAIKLFSDISWYKDSSSWLAKCREASQYTGTFTSYIFKIYDDDGDVHDIPAGQNYGDAKSLRISATIDENLEITYCANGRKAEKGSLYVYYHKYSVKDDDTTIDIAARTITTQFYHGSSGTKSDKYVAWYK